MHRRLAGQFQGVFFVNTQADHSPLQRVRTLTEFRTMAVTPYPIQCLRDRKWIQIQTDHLLPGDVVSVGLSQTSSVARISP